MAPRLLLLKAYGAFFSVCNLGLFLALLCGGSRLSAQQIQCLQLFEEQAGFSESLDALAEGRELSGQEHPYLKRKRYVLASGGLCGPTSANISLTDLASKISSDDARYGLVTKDLMRLIQTEGRRRGHSLELKAASVEEGNGVPVVSRFDEKFFVGDGKNTAYILITDVYSQRGTSRKYVWSHFSVGFDFNAQEKTIQIVDPLYPKQVTVGKLVPTVLPNGGRSTFSIEFDKPIAGYPARPLVHLTEVIKINKID